MANQIADENIAKEQAREAADKATEKKRSDEDVADANRRVTTSKRKLAEFEDMTEAALKRFFKEKMQKAQEQVETAQRGLELLSRSKRLNDGSGLRQALLDG